METARAPLPETLARPPRGRVLVFAPHADDEVFGCGGTLALHREQGDPVRVVVGFGPTTETRRAEAVAASAHLGTIDHVFWDEPGGHVPGAADLERGVRAAIEEIEAYRPSIVYAPWAGEHHVDHHVLARVVASALERGGAAIEGWAYEVWTPLVPRWIVDVSAVARRKARALAAHASQTAHTPLVRASLGLAAQRALYLPKGARFGEAFASLHRARERCEAA